MKNLCIIPARGGSKRIPRKNIKLFLGKPIIQYSIEAALKCNLFDEVMVSTDDEEVLEISRSYGAEIPFLRSEVTSNDFAGLSEVLIEVVNEYEKRGKFFDTICCLLPTAPFITFKQLGDAISLFKEKKYNCVFSAVEYSYPIQRSLKIENDNVLMRWPENFHKRSQDLESSFHDAGQFYIIQRDALFEEKRLFTTNAGCVVLDELHVQDVDTEIDWKMAELKYKLNINY